jgi:hypothetical protein
MHNSVAVQQAFTVAYPNYASLGTGGTSRTPN